jgi:hypothetical protein
VQPLILRGGCGLIGGVSRFLPTGVLLLAALCTMGRSQGAETAPVATSQAGDELKIFLITMEAGDEIFEKFGHNAIVVHDAAAGTERLYNYGVFDFDQHRFFVKFLRGELDYWMESYNAADALAWYSGNNRGIWAQELNLSPAQKVALRDFLLWNERDENKYYRYNYYTDNCSTRVRDAIDRALGGQIKAQLQDKPTGVSWRWHTRRLTQVEPLWYTLLNTVLAPATDRPISRWEESFLPMKFAQHIRSVTIKDQAGRDVPLVKSEREIFISTRPPEPTAPPKWWWVVYFLIGAAIGAILIVTARLAPQRRWARIAFRIVATGYAILLAFCGCFGVWVWFGSSHWAAWRNENLFAYSPLALPLIVAIGLMTRKNPRGVQVAVVSAILVAASTLIGLVASIFLPQDIREPMALVLPINLALAWSVWHYASNIHAAKAHVPPHPQRAS